MAKEQLKYYKGEKSNPFEEVNETQGAWCQRYNRIASILWFFEYHWENGWETYRKLEPRLNCYYFEFYPQPQRTFKTLESALEAFASYTSSDLLCGCKDWAVYLYENAMQERFYEPACQIVLKKDVPKYLLYWNGTTWNEWQYKSNQKSVGCSYWWNFEYKWYSNTPNTERTEANWQKYLQEYIMRNSKCHPKSKEYQQELQQLLERYKSWRQ